MKCANTSKFDFRTVLQKYKDRILAEGDPSGQAADNLRGSITTSGLRRLGERCDTLLSQFKARAGIGDLSVDQDEMLLREYRKGYRSLLVVALGKGAWRDNVLVERLWRTIKYEEVYLRAHASVSEARAGIGRYLGFYNSRRPHSSLDGKTPDQACFNQPMPKSAAA